MNRFPLRDRERQVCCRLNSRNEQLNSFLHETGNLRSENKIMRVGFHGVLVIATRATIWRMIHAFLKFFVGLVGWGGNKYAG